MANGINWQMVGVVAVILVLTNAFGARDLISGLGGGQAAEPSAPMIECIHSGITLTVGPTEKRYAATTSTSSEYHRLIVNGIDRGLKADSATETVSYKDDIEVYYAENSSTYYAAKHTFAVPCSAAFTAARMPDSDSYKLIAVATPTISFFNSDDGLKNTDSTAEDPIGTNEIATPELRIKLSSNAGYSPKGDMILTVKYNSSAYDDVELSGSGISSASTPQFRSNDNSTAGYALESFKLSGIDSDTTETITINMEVDAKTGVNPTTGGGDINVFLDDEDWFRNSDTGLMEFGAETEDDADVGDTTERTATYYVS